MRNFYVVRDRATGLLYPLRKGAWVNPNDTSCNRPFQPFYSREEAQKVVDRCVRAQSAPAWGKHGREPFRSQLDPEVMQMSMTEVLGPG